MSTAVLPDQDLEELLGREVPCDQDENCVHPGEWLYVQVCCGRRFILCVPHHESAKIVAAHSNYTWYCYSCKTTLPRGKIPYRVICRL